MLADTSHRRCATEGCLTSVDRAESETQETVVVLVLNELLANLTGSLDGLALGSNAAHSNSVLINIAAGTAAVAIADVPASTIDLGGVSRRLVDIMTGLLGLGELLGEDPAGLSLVKHFSKMWRTTYYSQIGRASVKVKVQGCTADADRSQVLNVVGLGRSHNSTATRGNSALEVRRHSTAILGKGPAVDRGEVGSLGTDAGSLSGDLVDRESPTSMGGVRGTGGQRRGDGGEADRDGSDFAQDNHGDCSLGDMSRRQKRSERLD